MARTAGAISLVSVRWEDLQEIIPQGYKGFVTVQKKWLDTFQHPSEEMVMVKRDDLLGGVREIEQSDRPQAAPVARPKAIIEMA